MLVELYRWNSWYKHLWYFDWSCNNQWCNLCSSQLTNVATDFGTGRVSGDNFGDADGGSTFTGSFNGDGGLTGLSTDLNMPMD